MSISLNDHEKRIKALENKVHNSNVEYKTLFNGWWDRSSTINLSEPLSNFDLILVEVCQDTNYWDTDIYSGKYPVQSGSNYMIAHTIGRFCVKVATDTWNRTSLRSTQHEATIRKIIGLKIYYIFRYNIYNKIIRSIISTFCNFINISPLLNWFHLTKEKLILLQSKILKLTKYFTSQLGDFYNYLREVEYDMEIISNIS